MLFDQIGKKIIGEKKLKIYRSLPIWYKVYKFAFTFLLLIIWIYSMFLVGDILGKKNTYLPFFLMFWLFLSIPVYFYLLNWLLYFFGKKEFVNKIEKIYKKNELPSFRKTQKDLLKIIYFLLPVYILFFMLLFLNATGYSKYSLIALVIGIIVEIIWILLFLKR